MAKIQDVIDETLAIIDGALAILQKFPDLNQTDISLSHNASLNPLPFLIDLFKRTAGYNVLINIVAKFIAWNIPMIDAGVKGVLLTKLKDIISCSVNPFFTEEILREGIVFNAAEIDIADVLKYSPFDEEVGQYFYFDAGNFEEEYAYNDTVNQKITLKKRLVPGIPDDLIKSDDLNCLIWYMLNKSNKRHVWKPKKYRKGDEFRMDYPHEMLDESHIMENYDKRYNALQSTLDEYNSQWEEYQVQIDNTSDEKKKKQLEIEQHELGKEIEKLQKEINKLYENPDKYVKNFNKLKKEDGIITLEYCHNIKDVKDAYGNKMPLQTPYGNYFHVFIGDAREKEDGPIMRQLKDSNELKIKDDKDTKKYIDKINELNGQILDLETYKEGLFNIDFLSQKDLQREYNKTQIKINELKAKLQRLKNKQENTYLHKQELQHTFQDIKNNWELYEDTYFPFLNDEKVRNYYYGKSLIEFNIDYITSLELFDAKSLAARLLDCLTASLVIDLHLSYKQQLIKNEVKKMVQMVTETDDLVISDCFFTFTNKDYDEMSRKAELRKAGLLTINGDETSAVKIDAKNIFAKLNEINKDTNQETIQTIISGAITDISKELSSVEYSHEDDVNFGVEINFIENILQSLAEVITMTVLSPKVYLLLLINLKIIGRETNFNLEGFLAQYKQLIADIIRSIRDIILEYITKELMKIVGELVKEVTIKFSVEQALYWQRLYKRLIDCFKYKRQKFNIDFSIDDVDYADILPSDTEPKNNEC